MADLLPMAQPDVAHLKHVWICHANSMRTIGDNYIVLPSTAFSTLYQSLSERQGFFPLPL